MGVSREQQMECYRIVSAILHLGNIEFTESRRSEEAQVDARSAEGRLARVQQ